MGHCPEDCFDKAMEAYKMATDITDDLNDQDIGIKARLRKIEDCIKDKISATSIKFFITVFGLALLGIIGTGIITWSDVRALNAEVPKEEKRLEQTEKDISRLKTESAVMKTKLENIESNTMQIINLIKEKQSGRPPQP